MQEMVRSTFNELHSIWEDVGYDKETQSDYIIAALDHIRVKFTLDNYS